MTCVKVVKVYVPTSPSVVRVLGAESSPSVIRIPALVGPPGPAGSGGALTKAGRLIPADFAGDPLVATVAFVTPYDDADYTVSLQVESIGHGYAPRVENKTLAGFDVHLCTNQTAGLIDLTWAVMPFGEVL